jgi:HSP20 family protein
MAEKTSEVATRQPQSVARREQHRSPFDMFADEIERLFDDFGFGRGVLTRPWSSRAHRQGALEMWTPQIELSQQNNELVVRADLPGLKKEDINIDITDESITISGERHQEHESDSGGVYRSERSYGSFYRAIPLPHGAISDQAKATFKDGVVEIRVPAPPEQVNRGRRIEIQDAAQKK